MNMAHAVHSKCFKGENFCSFHESFPLCTVHNGLGLKHHESFPVNNMFCAQSQSFPPRNIWHVATVIRDVNLKRPVYHRGLTLLWKKIQYSIYIYIYISTSYINYYHAHFSFLIFPNL